ncbi:MAG: 2-hydroxychromene-2-carboxylate isomerase [Pseudomonadota bacterium]
MQQTLEFYFDFGSPTAYLAHKRLRQLTTLYTFDIDYRPMLLGGVFKATGNTTPVAVPAKGAYMLNHDLPRFVQRYGVVLNFNPHFPINTLNLMRGAIAAEQLDCVQVYIDAVFDAVWIDGKDMGDANLVRQVLSEADLDAEALIEKSQHPDVKAALIAATEAAVERGAFGAPTMFLGDAMYFGQDRLDFVEEALSAP